jgi:hypothetical protein
MKVRVQFQRYARFKILVLHRKFDRKCVLAFDASQFVVGARAAVEAISSPRCSRALISNYPFA